jgi:hypothetical protein
VVSLVLHTQSDMLLIVSFYSVLGCDRFRIENTVRPACDCFTLQYREGATTSICRTFRQRKVMTMSVTWILLVETLIFLILWLVWLSPRSIALIPCQFFIENCRGDLDKENTNKSYQEKDERFNMEE